MSLSKPQAQALAHLIHQLRPEWDEPGIMAQLAKVVSVNPFDTAMACIRAAANEAAKSPGVISVTTGEHWREKVSKSDAPYPPRREEACLDCGAHLDQCRCGNHRVQPPGKNPRNAEHAKAARELLAKGLGA